MDQNPYQSKPVPERRTGPSSLLVLLLTVLGLAVVAMLFSVLLFSAAPGPGAKTIKTTEPPAADAE